ncbi:hypothetical protein AYI70_g3709 [Smittium culicis]|uniref:Transcription factor domain-containing protein n=1 Tax=Smittium culicis TaxID=133412 RepID=A0A1R1Y275_9FUNG|nr:hypothetical protein AYI70_g3709 [Smittium culicis]
MKLKLFKIDSVSKYLSHFDPEKLELSRRVWWVFFFYTRSNYIFLSGFPVVENADIAVNLPSNDFYWSFEVSQH